jgi:hypothetical protein
VQNQRSRCSGAQEGARDHDGPLSQNRTLPSGKVNLAGHLGTGISRTTGSSRKQHNVSRSIAALVDSVLPLEGAEALNLLGCFHTRRYNVRDHIRLHQVGIEVSTFGAFPVRAVLSEQARQIVTGRIGDCDGAWRSR